MKVLTEELGVHLIAGKFVPKVLTADRMQQHVSVYTELQQLTLEGDIWSRVMASDESWVYG